MITAPQECTGKAEAHAAVTRIESFQLAPQSDALLCAVPRFPLECGGAFYRSVRSVDLESEKHIGPHIESSRKRHDLRDIRHSEILFPFGDRLRRHAYTRRKLLLSQAVLAPQATDDHSHCFCCSTHCFNLRALFSYILYHKPTRMHSNKTAMPLNAALKTAVRGVFYTDTHECLCLQKVFRKLNAAEEGSTVVIVSGKYALSGEFVSSGIQYRRKYRRHRPKQCLRRQVLRCNREQRKPGLPCIPRQFGLQKGNYREIKGLSALFARIKR